MEAAPEKAINDDFNIFYTMYKDLPVGAALVNGNMTIISSNRLMCGYFSHYEIGIDGLSVCRILNCRQNKNKCEKCNIRNTVCRNINCHTPTESFSIKSGTKKWFKINGMPVKYGGKNYAALLFYDITEQKLNEKSLREELALDRHTKALNKCALMEYLDAVLADKNRKPFTLCMLDFDDFKNINDTCGHLEGDRVLTAFSEIARKNIRADDIFGRFGGEEFIFIFTDTKITQSVKIIKRIQNELREYFAAKLPMPVTFSAGVVYAGADDRFSRDELIAYVDKLLYKAKRGGKNRIEAN